MARPTDWCSASTATTSECSNRRGRRGLARADARRINRPAGKLGSQSVIAQISLDLAKSAELKEKTNREGFDENAAFRRLKRVSVSVFDLFPAPALRIARRSTVRD